MPLQLHRAQHKPDWELAPAAEHSIWQRWAARSHGILTPGNAASVLGVLLVALGLAEIARRRLWPGLFTLGIGRLLDIIDGTLAEYTRTKSPLGESIDASLDKAAVFAALLVFTLSGIVPLALALFIGAQNALTASLSLAAKSLKRTIHPVSAGKIGGAVVWVSLLGFVLGSALSGGAAAWCTDAAYVLAVVSVLLNSYATLRYAQALAPGPPKSDL